MIAMFRATVDGLGYGLISVDLLTASIRILSYTESLQCLSPRYWRTNRVLQARDRLVTDALHTLTIH